MAFYYIEVPKNFREVGSDGFIKTSNPRVAVEYFNGALKQAEPPKENRREVIRKLSDGQEYINRWAFGKKCEIADPDGNRYYTAYLSDCDGGIFPGSNNRFEPVVRSRNYWDGNHLIHLWMAHHQGAAGTPPYWRVYADCWVFNYSAVTPPTRVNQWVRLPNKRLNKTTDFRDSLGNSYELASQLYSSIESEAMLPFELSTWSAGTVQVMRCINGMALPFDPPRFSANAELWKDATELGVGAGKTFSQLLSEAYMDAFNQLPDLSGMNNAVNAIQLVQAGLSIGKAIFTGDALDAIGSASDAWLAYRYSYGTTKSDIEEVASYLGRAADLIDVDRIHSNGRAILNVKDDDTITVKCSIEVGQSELAPLKSTIERYGLQMDAYAMWDMIPYSFIADWFLGVGDALERARSANFARRLKKGCWCSIERRWTNEFGFKEIYYHRLFTHPGVSYRTIQKSGTSGSTIVKRGLDALALFL